MSMSIEGVVLTVTVTVLVLVSLSQYVMIWRLRHDRRTHLYAYPTTVFPLMTRRICLLALLVCRPRNYVYVYVYAHVWRSESNEI